MCRNGNIATPFSVFLPEKHVQWIWKQRCLRDGDKARSTAVPDDSLHVPISPERLLPRCTHSMHVNTVASVNVAIVCTWAYFIRVGGTTCSVVLSVSHFKTTDLALFTLEETRVQTSPLCLDFCPLLCPSLCLNGAWTEYKGTTERSFSVFLLFFLTFSFFNSFCIDCMMCYSFVFKVGALEGDM